MAELSPACLWGPCFFGRFSPVWQAEHAATGSTSMESLRKNTPELKKEKEKRNKNKQSICSPCGNVSPAVGRSLRTIPRFPGNSGAFWQYFCPRSKDRSQKWCLWCGSVQFLQSDSQSAADNIKDKTLFHCRQNKTVSFWAEHHAH